MTNKEFKEVYTDYLNHSWATSKDPTIYAKQKQREKEYNAEYYKKNKDNIKKSKTTRNMIDINTSDKFISIDRKYAKSKAGSKMLRNAQDSAMNDSIKKTRNSQRKKAGSKMFKNAQENAMNKSVKKARNKHRRNERIKEDLNNMLRVGTLSIDRKYAKSKAGSKMLRNAQDSAMNDSIKKTRNSQRKKR